MLGLKSVRRRRYDALSRVSWQEFEHLMARYYRDNGYRVEHVGTGATHGTFDGGIDLKLYRDGEYVVVQCKHWNARQVPHNDIHQLIGVMHTERAHRAIFVTSGECTRAARAAAAKFPQFQLIDGDAVRTMLGPVGAPLFAHWGSSRDRGERLPPWMAGHSVAGRYVSTWMVHALLKIAAFPLAMLLIYYISTTFMREAFSQLLSHPAPAASSMVSTQSPGRRAAVPQTYSARTATHPTAGAPEPVYQSTPMTDSELKDWKRRNAEAMKIIEKTTPEI